jgi:hypothetical protein
MLTIVLQLLPIYISKISKARHALEGRGNAGWRSVKQDYYFHLAHCDHNNNHFPGNNMHFQQLINNFPVDQSHFNAKIPTIVGP